MRCNPVIAAKRQSRVIFRADGNTATGLGHVVRSLVLAQAFHHRGHAVAFVTQQDNPLLRDEWRWKGLEVVVLPRRVSLAEDAARTAALASAPVFVVDGYRFGVSYQRALARVGQVVVIDDLAQGEFAADVIVNHHLHAPQLAYARPQRGGLLLGPRYALVRSEFCRIKPRLGQRTPPPWRVLICFGGSDPGDMTARALRALRGVARTERWQVRVIIGPGYRRLAGLMRVAHGYRHIEVFQNPHTVAKHMAWADVGLLSAGSVMLEAMACGLPPVLIAIVENQRPALEAAGRQRRAVALGWHKEVSEDSLIDAVRGLLQDEDERLRLSKLGRTTVDCCGPERVVAKVESWLM